MAFNVEKLFKFCHSAIARFSREHTTETFYAFAIDANMLCLNSLEQFSETLKQYQDRWDFETRAIESIADLTEEDWRNERFGLSIAEKYCGLDRNNQEAVLAEVNQRRSQRRADGCEVRTPEGIQSLRENTGDWAYQGFADLEKKNGFDDDLYSDHYDEAGGADDGHAPNTAYAIAMTELVDRLRRSDAFNLLRLSNDFEVSWVDHDY